MKRILFVDDESKILDGIRRLLHADRGRWDMQFVTSGDEALRACEASAFGVVISDMRMPGMFRLPTLCANPKKGAAHSTTSREAAQECSPRREPWVKVEKDKARKGERKVETQPRDALGTAGKACPELSQRDAGATRRRP